MSFKPNGVIFILLIFISSLLGSIFLLVPFLPCIKFAPKVWRLCADRLVGYWLTFPTSLVEIVFGTRFRVTGDVICRNKPALIIMNHRTRLDWMFLWNVLYKMDPWLLTTEKISLKAPLKKIPGAGWAMQCGSYLFLERNFEADRENIEKMVDYWASSGQTYQMLLFPEGTDRGERATKLSNDFAEKNGLPRYDYVLHPRTTGFNYFIELMKQRNYIDYVYDITLAYPQNIVDSEVKLLTTGEFPKEVHADVKQYSIDSIGDSAVSRASWLTTLWAEKEAKLREFYEETRELSPSGARFLWEGSNTGLGYIVAFSFWTCSSLLWIYLIYTHFLVKLYVVASCVVFVVIGVKFGGVEFVSIDLKNLK